MENKYTIILAQYTYGSLTQVVNKDQVIAECERLKAIFSKQPEKCYTIIEVVNNQTGECREYWNNHDNKINF